MRCWPAFFAAVLVSSLSGPAQSRVAPAPPLYSFAFPGAPAAPGAIAITSGSVFSEAKGYGLEVGADLNNKNRPFLFSVTLPEGNYRVTARFGDAQSASRGTVKAESRRLMIQDVQTAPGEFQTRTFAVNIRTPALKNGERVHLKPREAGVLHWDNKLTLEISTLR